MENLELDIFQQESSLISKLKEQVSLLKGGLRDKEHENSTLRSHLLACQEQMEMQAITASNKDKVVEELRSLTERLLALNSNLQASFEKGEAEKLELAERLEEMSELSAKQLHAFTTQVNELKETCVRLMREGEISSARFTEEINIKHHENESLKKEIDSVTRRFSLTQSELEQRLRIESDNHTTLITAKNDEIGQFQKSIEMLKQELIARDLQIIELNTLLKNSTNIDSVIKDKETAIEKLKANFETQIASMKSQMEIDATKYDSFKSDLRHKYKKKLMTLSEQHDEQLITMTTDYKQECVALRADNKQLFEENTALKAEFSAYKDTTDRLINDKDEIIFVTQKSAKQEKRKLEEKIKELENQNHILAAEKADLLTDFDSFQNQINQLTSTKFQLLKENKLLINKLVNLTEYPSLRPANKLSRSLSPNHMNYEDDLNESNTRNQPRHIKNDTRFKGDKLRTERSVIVDEIKPKVKSSIKNQDADDELSVKQSFLNNFSLTPKFLNKQVQNVRNESQSKKDSLFKTENQNRFNRMTETPLQGKESLSAMEVIKDLRRRNGELESDLREREDEIKELESTISSMQSQMKEIGLLSAQRMDEIKLLSDQNQAFLSKIEKLNAQVRSSTVESQNLRSQLSDKERETAIMTDCIASLEQVI